MCPHCRAFVTIDDRVCPYCDAQLEPRRVYREPSSGAILGRMIPQAHFTTMMIITINIGLYLVMVAYSMSAGNDSALMNLDPQTLVQFGAKYQPFIVLGGQWWRLITAGFLHLSLLHILMNSWVLFDLGAQVEELYGTARFIAIYFFSTAAGFFASLTFTAALSAGASAGLFGLIGAMIALSLRDKTGMGSMIRGLYIRWVIYVTIIGLFLGADHAAHFGGGIAGFVLGYITGTPSAFGGTVEKVWRGVAAIAVFLTVMSFAKMVLFVLR
ncbi:MAG: rhomboid family intramembrane serine protease [Bryobacteraceae bacterium]|nr:rhomboid family intramembrane serine protease [Bryobacteraceae bacterium]